jgi:hypothetical protein
MNPDSIVQGKGKRKGTDLMQIEEEDPETVAAESDEERQGFSMVDAWPNIGPVLDFCVLESEGGGAVS